MTEGVLSDWAEYFEQAWAIRGKELDAILDGEGDLSRVLAALDRFNETHQLVVNGTEASFGNVTADPDPVDKVTDRAGRFCAGTVVEASPFHGIDRRRLLADFAQGRDCVLDIGGGYGRALFDCWLGGGPRDARYVNAEPTASGRGMALKLAPLARGMAFSCVDWRMEDPDFSCLGDSSNILVVSSLSIYCTWRFPLAFFRRLAALDATVDCLFIEPLGHQLGGDDPFTQAQVANAVDKRLNTSFWDVLTEASRDGLVEALAIARDFDGRVDEPNAQVSLFALRILRDRHHQA